MKNAEDRRRLEGRVAIVTGRALCVGGGLTGT
jgi:hypothetical protein